MYAMIVIILVLAIAMLFAFERSTANRRKVGGMSVATALVVATVTVLAFDVGMVGWMLVLHFTELLPSPGSVNFLSSCRSVTCWVSWLASPSSPSCWRAASSRPAPGTRWPPSERRVGMQRRCEDVLTGPGSAQWRRRRSPAALARRCPAR